MALCLFRIVQEALRNVVKHQVEAVEAQVELYGHGDHLDLGSSLTQAQDSALRLAKEGLGLISMRERLRSASGDNLFPLNPSRRGWDPNPRVHVPNVSTMRAA